MGPQDSEINLGCGVSVTGARDAVSLEQHQLRPAPMQTQLGSLLGAEIGGGGTVSFVGLNWVVSGCKMSGVCRIACPSQAQLCSATSLPPAATPFGREASPALPVKQHLFWAFSAWILNPTQRLSPLYSLLQPVFMVLLKKRKRPGVMDYDTGA